MKLQTRRISGQVGPFSQAGPIDREAENNGFNYEIDPEIHAAPLIFYGVLPGAPVSPAMPKEMNPCRAGGTTNQRRYSTMLARFFAVERVQA